VQEDSHVVARLRASGAVLVGKNNKDEAARGAAPDKPH
jgi:aspartyl-tRNA(Asn)/glutamyl-tRNA(Gln) amidotransferase subunit A